MANFEYTKRGVTMRLAVLAIYNLILLVGTAYLVGWQGWSGWWFLFTMLLLASGKDCKE